MLFFALMVVVLFSLAFDPTAAISRQIAGGILCVATLFASVTGLNQAWARDLGVNGTFFSALSVRPRNRELLLPLLLFPIFVPALLGLVEATTAILLGDSEPALWIKLLAGYDVIFTTVSLLLFSTVLNAE